MPQTPNSNVAIADLRTGQCTDAWQSYFQALSAPAGADRPITVTASPFTYAAPANGHLIVQGGIIAGVDLVRGRHSIPLAAAPPLIPLSAGDRAVVTYSAPPNLVFLPS